LEAVTSYAPSTVTTSLREHALFTSLNIDEQVQRERKERSPVLFFIASRNISQFK